MSELTVHVGAEVGTFVDVLRANAERAPELTAFTALTFPAGGDDRGERTRLSRGRLDRRCRALAEALAPYAGRGDRVLVLLPPGLDFLVGVFGTLYAGAVAVACPPPTDGPDDPRTERAIQIAGDAEVSVVVTLDRLRRELAGRREQLAGGATWIAVDTLDETTAGGYRRPELRGDDLALLQYTSGSTGAPKGVMVSHRNLMHQLAQMRQLADLPAAANVVTWISPYHALGVAGHLMLSQYVGGQAVFLAPEDFIARPVRWLRAISDTFGPVLSCAPNFAFDRCVDQIPPAERAGLDLSGWHTTFNAAERIRPQTIARFTEAFAPYGFRPTTMASGFGMTETMLFITGRHADPEPTVLQVDAAELERGRAVLAPDAGERRLRLVGVGVPGVHCQVLVVDPERREPVEAGRVGEVWVGGSINCQGYWRRDELTAETFRARLADGSGPFVRTGDLGFRYEGELVLCGRLKELIIIRGRNLYPQDVELTSERVHPALAGAPVAAFSVDGDEGERLVVVQSVPDPDALEVGVEELARRIRAAITSDHEVEAHEVLVVPPSEVSKTVSGKVQRGQCRSRYLAGELTALAIAGRTAAAAPAPAPAGRRAGADVLRAVLQSVDDVIRPMVVSADLRRRLGELLARPISDIAEDVPLAGMGLESLPGTELRTALHSATGVDVPLATLMGSSVGELAQHVAASFEQKEVAPADVPPARLAAPEPPPAAVEPVSAAITTDEAGRHEPFPLTDLQDAYLRGRSGGDADAGGSDLYFELEAGALDTDRLHAALTALVERHDMLRATVTADGRQQVLPAATAGPVPMPVTDLSGVPTDGVEEHLASVREELAHRPRPAGPGPLWQVRVSRLPGGGARVHVSIDRLIADVASVRVFFEDWRRLYEGESLPPLRLTFRDFVGYTEAARERPEYARARDYWRDRLAELPDGPRLPPGAGGSPRWVRHAHRLSASDWERVKQAAARHRVTPSAVLLAGFAVVLGRWSRSDHFLLRLPLLDRAPLHPDLDAVIGDFTGVTLLEVDLRGADGIAAVAARLQQQLWRDLEHREYSGVEVLRELARTRPVGPGGPAPVGFLSAREQTWGALDPDTGVFGQHWLGRTSFAVSRGPHSVLEHQVYEHGGALEFHWDTPAGALAPGVLEAMFEEYCALLERLAAGTGDWSGWADERPGQRAAGQPARPKLVFMFPGPGSERPGMGAELYAAEPRFRREVDACAEALTGPLGTDLRPVLFPDPRADPRAAAEQLQRPDLAQPALFTIEYALARLLEAWGVRPDAMVGHGVGEITAACLSGVLSRADALRLVAARGRLTQQLAPGAMLAVSMAAGELRRLLTGALSLAEVNGPELCTVAGPPDEIAALEIELGQLYVPCKRLRASRAYQSVMVEPMLAPLAAELAGLTLHPPTVPYVSNLTGRWITAEETTDPDYWLRHPRAPIRFGEALELLTDRAGAVLVEVGPGDALGRLAGQAPHRVATVATLTGGGEQGPPGPEPEALRVAAARLWSLGAEVDFAAMAGGGGGTAGPPAAAAQSSSHHHVPERPNTRASTVPGRSEG